MSVIIIYSNETNISKNSSNVSGERYTVRTLLAKATGHSVSPRTVHHTRFLRTPFEIIVGIDRSALFDHSVRNSTDVLPVWTVYVDRTPACVDVSHNVRRIPELVTHDARIVYLYLDGRRP